MLRNFVLGLAVAILLVSAFAVAEGVVGAWVPIVWCAIVAAAIVFERYRYKPLKRSEPGQGWEKTGERFVDDETGKLVTVWIRPDTGERAYVRE